MAAKDTTRVSGHIVDVVHGTILDGIICIEQGKIREIIPSGKVEDVFLLPGLIDAHIHIESSMLIPSEFARLAVIHGTVATVSDPHEIANVLGIAGVNFMIENGRRTPFRFCFGAPSCVPATSFETSGKVISVNDIEILLENDEVGYLAEMMNFPGVVSDNPEVMAKLELAKKHNKPIDGHAPGLSGEALEKYAAAGISTDHECFTLEEAYEKIKLGMHILIREGSAARNFDALIPILSDFPEKVMFCSDDKHPDELVHGHMNLLVKRALAKGCKLFDVLRACTLNPAKHYRLASGLLQPGDSADFIIVDDLKHFTVLQTYIKGQKVAENGMSLLPHLTSPNPNNFVAEPLIAETITIRDQNLPVKVICATEGQLVTSKMEVQPNVVAGNVESDTDRDILKLVVYNRYEKSTPALGLLHGLGLNSGAIASTVSHDSHNIICAGTDDTSIVKAINSLIENKGGICVVTDKGEVVLPLPVAGLMSDKDGFEVARLYESINCKVKEQGSILNAPFMTLSFMALLVIPELKLSDKGLFDGNKFQFTDLFVKD